MTLCLVIRCRLVAGPFLQRAQLSTLTRSWYFGTPARRKLLLPCYQKEVLPRRAFDFGRLFRPTRQKNSARKTPYIRASPYRSVYWFTPIVNFILRPFRRFHYNYRRASMIAWTVAISFFMVFSRTIYDWWTIWRHLPPMTPEESFLHEESARRRRMLAFTTGESFQIPFIGAISPDMTGMFSGERLAQFLREDQAFDQHREENKAEKWEQMREYWRLLNRKLMGVPMPEDRVDWKTRTAEPASEKAGPRSD